MIAYFLDFMLQILRQAFSNWVFILPLGFITLTISVSLFRKMGGRV